MNVTAIGTTKDPHFDGTVDLANAAFAVRTTGSRYKNGHLAVRFTSDRMAVDALHLEDRRGRALDVSGSLGTHELRVGELEIDATAKDFEVMRNEFGNTEIDARLSFRGRFESPRVEGTIGISGGTLNVDEILAADAAPPVRDGSHSRRASRSRRHRGAQSVGAPRSRYRGEVAGNAPHGRRQRAGQARHAAGAWRHQRARLWRSLPVQGSGQQLFVTGSFDSLTGTYSFQGRRFDLDPISSIIFRGDLNPELYVTVKRTISGSRRA